jgi:hypothetical protein
MKEKQEESTALCLFKVACFTIAVIATIASLFSDSGSYDASKKFREDQEEIRKMQDLERKYKMLENNQNW